jgi:hypothetical protein
MSAALYSLICMTALSCSSALFGADTLNTLAVRLDAQGKLLAWVDPQ